MFFDFGPNCARWKHTKNAVLLSRFVRLITEHMYYDFFRDICMVIYKENKGLKVNELIIKMSYKIL